MLNSRNKKLAILTAVAISILILGMFQNIKFAHAQDYEEKITLPQNFSIDEFSENIGRKENITSIDIDLGSSRWNVTEIELNFTNIKQEYEFKTIEDIADYTNKKLDKNFDKGFAVQLNISEKTTIYGVYINGYISNAPLISNVYVQINGYDVSNDAPNNEIYGTPVKLNMSLNIIDWYYQNFSHPIPLNKGQYFLVINASEYIVADNSKIYWFYSKENANNPNLNISIWDGIWSNGLQGEPFLYKLHQKINKSYYPEDIGMYTEINGISQPILDGDNIGEGNLINDTLNFKLSEPHLHIPLKSNFSIIFNFTLDYRINLENYFFADGSVTFNTNSKIQWDIDFNLNRSDGNYSVQFIAWNSWENFTVLKDSIDITDDNNVSIVGNIITIKNDIITSVDEPWRIKADSDNVPIDFSLPKLEFKAGVEQFVLDINTLKKGNYTFVLYALGRKVYDNQTTYINQPSLSFTYSIPSDALNGEWIAAIYWNNNTDAGVKTESFTVSGGVTLIYGDGGGGGGGGTTTVTGLDPILVTIVSIIIIASVVAALASYQTVRRFKRKRDLELKTLQSKFIDILSLNYLLVVDKKTGLNVYEQFFAGKKIDASLISGFFEAIRNFGIELTGTYTQSQSVKLEYQESKIIMSEFRNFRLIFVMTENPSEDFLTTITNFSYDIEEKFGEFLQDFRGDTTKFRDIRKLVEKNFYVSFIAPLMVRDVSDMKLKDAEIAMINKAKAIMKQNNLNYFFTSFLLPEQTYDPKKTRTIFNLIDKKIFIPTKLT